MTDKIFAAIIGAVVVWLIKSFFSHQVKKVRFRVGLIADINLHIQGAKGQIVAVKDLVEETAKVGESLPFPIAYNIDSYSFFSGVQKELPSYLSQDELVKVIKFYQAIWQLDVSVNALATTMGLWERDKTKLTTENIEHLNKRKERIDSFFNLVASQSITQFSALPSDYSGIKGPETVVK